MFSLQYYFPGSFPCRQIPLLETAVTARPPSICSYWPTLPPYTSPLPPSFLLYNNYLLPSNPPAVFGMGHHFGNSRRICRLFNQDSYGEKKKKISTKFTIISQKVGFAYLQKLQHACKLEQFVLNLGNSRRTFYQFLISGNKMLYKSNTILRSRNTIFPHWIIVTL